MIRKYLTPEQAFQKLKHYCAYQERCHYEVRQKAYELGLRKADVEEQIANLIEEGYLNEERFARMFSRGKFSLKNWGRIKIRNELRMKKMSDYCISKGMTEIDDEEYEKVLKTLAKEKWKKINSRGANRFVKMTKTRNYLLQKGFEPHLIMKAINELV